MSRFLITTALEETWPTDETPVLFLGEWCRLYERRAVLEQLNSEVVPYHWDDRKQLYQDYLYLRNLYEDLLTELGEALNMFHGTEYSIRYWRILVGPWLGYFTQILFDRWTMIQRTVRDYGIEKTVLLDLPLEQAIPNDKADFDKFYVNDLWNHVIYGCILSRWTNVPCKHIPAKEAFLDKLASTSSCARHSIMNRFVRSVAKKVLSNSLMSRPTDSFLISSYLPPKCDFYLQMSLGQFPKRWVSPPAPRVPPNIEIRQRLRLKAHARADFEQCARSLIPEHIPTLYLEGFQKLRMIVDKLAWPKQPRVIFSSNSFNSDDIFKAWAGEKVESGSRLIIGQHGGHYGTGLWSFSEEHEQAISDRYLTWGWNDGGQKQYPVGALKLMGKHAGTWNPNGGILLVTAVAPRYSYWMYSIMIAGQTAHYLNDQLRFAAVLPDKLRHKLLVRLYSQDMGWSQAARWHDSHPDVQVDPGTKPIKALIKQCRIYVATYNATTFLETLASNIPTVIFWNPAHWELRLSAQPYFDRLRQVGIFHETPESAAFKIAKVWDDVANWWNQPEVQEARLYFCDRFARMPDKPIQILKQALAT